MSHISRRAAALAGIAVAPVFLGITLVATVLQLDFLRSLGWSLTGVHEVPFPSALARGDLGLLQTLNFAVTAVLVGLFAAGFRREFRRRISGGVATAGFGLIVAGLLLNVAPTDLPGEPVTSMGVAHVAGFVVTVLSMVLAYAASGLALRGNAAWRGWRLLGWTPVLMVVVFLTGAGLPGDLAFVAFVVLIFSWFSVMGTRVLAVDRGAAGRPDAAPLRDAAAPGLL